MARRAGERASVAAGAYAAADDGATAAGLNLTSDASAPGAAIASAVWSHVQLEVLSNHGHAAYTCLYRFRVHGRVL